MKRLKLLFKVLLFDCVAVMWEDDDYVMHIDSVNMDENRLNSLINQDTWEDEEDEE